MAYEGDNNIRYEHDQPQEEVVVVYEGDDGVIMSANQNGEPVVVDPAQIEMQGNVDNGGGGELRIADDPANYEGYDGVDQPYNPPAAYNQPPVYVHGDMEPPDPQRAASFRRMGTQRVLPDGQHVEDFEDRYKPIFCYVIIAINVLMFIIGIGINGGIEPLSVNPMIGPSNQVLLNMGAKLASKITSGDWYRLIAPMFLHAGLIHLLMNMSVLWRQGRDMERVVGWWRLALIYFSSGIFGIIMSCIFIPNVIGVGASGALFGILGAMFGEFIYNYKFIREGKWCYFTQLCLNSLFLFLLGLMPYLDNFAHIGGWLCGIVSSCVFLNGAYINPDNGKPTKKAFLFIICLALLTIMFITGLLVHHTHTTHNCTKASPFSTTTSTAIGGVLVASTLDVSKYLHFGIVISNWGVIMLPTPPQTQRNASFNWVVRANSPECIY